MGFCCGKNKNHIGRRLLKGFQQCVKSACGKHVNLVNNVNLIIALCGTVGYFLTDLTDIVHTIVGSRIDLDHIHGRSGLDRPAHLTLITGTSVYRIPAVDCLCKDLCHCCFTGSPCSAKQIGMTDTVRLDLVCQGCHNMILPFYIIKIIGPEFTVQGSIAHKSFSSPDAPGHEKDAAEYLSAVCSTLHCYPVYLLHKLSVAKADSNLFGSLNRLIFR